MCGHDDQLTVRQAMRVDKIRQNRTQEFTRFLQTGELILAQLQQAQQIFVKIARLSRSTVASWKHLCAHSSAGPITGNINNRVRAEVCTILTFLRIAFASHFIPCRGMRHAIGMGRHARQLFEQAIVKFEILVADLLGNRRDFVRRCP